MGPILLSLCIIADHPQPAPPDTVPVVASLPVAASWIVEGATTGVEHGALHLVSAALKPELGAGFGARIEFLGKWGHDEAVGFPSSQGLSSLDARDFSGLGEAWVEWAGVATRVKAGWVDANTEFAASASAAAFANPSFGLTPTLAFMPSYPAPQPSVNAFLTAVDGGELAAGAYRAADGDWSAVVQATGRMPYSSSLRWQAGVATCRHIVEDEGAAGPSAHGGGTGPSIYLIVDWVPTAGMAGFVKVAESGSMRHMAAGLTARVPVPREVTTGLAASTVSGPLGDEMVAELFLTARITEWLVVQPDLQVRLAPGDAPAAAGLLRMTVERRR